jgi:hypothetical protein
MELAATADGGRHHRVIRPNLLGSVVAGDHKVFVKQNNRGPLDFSVGDRELIGPDLKVMPKADSFKVVKDDSFLTFIAIPPFGLSFLKGSWELITGGGRLSCTR